MNSQESKDVQFETADGSIIHIFDDGVWLDVSTRLSFEEFEQLAGQVHEFANNQHPLDGYDLARIVQELMQFFGGKVMLTEVKYTVTPQQTGCYVVTLHDNRDGLLYACSTRGEYKQVLRQLHDMKTR